MKTSSFRLYTGPGRISIARYAPRGTPGGFRVFKGLAPGGWFNSVTPSEYLRRYEAEVLNQLDGPKKTWDLLHEMAGGHEPVLLCWEVLGPHECGVPGGSGFNQRNWCHRRIAAEFFSDYLQVEVPELTRENASPAQLAGL